MGGDTPRVIGVSSGVTLSSEAFPSWRPVRPLHAQTEALLSCFRLARVEATPLKHSVARLKRSASEHLRTNANKCRLCRLCRSRHLARAGREATSVGLIAQEPRQRGPALMGAVWDRATPYATRLLRSQVTLLSVNYL